jgi:hypothetical protein
MCATTSSFRSCFRSRVCGALRDQAPVGEVGAIANEGDAVAIVVTTGTHRTGCLLEVTEATARASPHSTDARCTTARRPPAAAASRPASVVRSAAPGRRPPRRGRHGAARGDDPPPRDLHIARSSSDRGRARSLGALTPPAPVPSYVRSAFRRAFVDHGSQCECDGARDAESLAGPPWCSPGLT